MNVPHRSDKKEKKFGIFAENSSTNAKRGILK